MQQTHHLLIVEPEPVLNEALSTALAHSPEFTILQAQTIQEANQALDENYIDLIISSQKMETETPTLIYGENLALKTPFKITALLSLIRAKLRQLEASDEAFIPLGDYQLHPTRKILKSATQNYKLTDKEAAMLHYLYKQQGEFVTRETLLSSVWGYHQGVTTHTIETHIYRLRQKLDNENFIITENGGYRLNL